VVSLAVAVMALSGIGQRYRSLSHVVLRVHAAGDAAALLAVAGRRAGTDTRRGAASSCP
jgi:hypothetical protein